LAFHVRIELVDGDYADTVYDAFVPTSGGIHALLLLFSCRTERSTGRTAAVRPRVTVGERNVLEPRPASTAGANAPTTV